MRTDKSLENVRKSPKFKTMMDKFDEPLFNVGWRRNPKHKTLNPQPET